MTQVRQVPVITNPEARYLWILDAGHGYDTPGKRSPVWPNGLQLLEYTFNRDMVQRIHRLALQEGLRVHILVQELYDVSLFERCKRINELRSELPRIVISNHANAFKKESVSGMEIYTSVGDTESDYVASTIMNTFVENLAQKTEFRRDYSDGDADKEAHFYILRKTVCPAVLIEYGFMTNKRECERLMDAGTREEMARQVVKAMLLYEEEA